jgi:hypothetical protein
MLIEDIEAGVELNATFGQPVGIRRAANRECLHVRFMKMQNSSGSPIAKAVVVQLKGGGEHLPYSKV